MMKTDDFLPEGSYGTLPFVRQALHSLEGLRRAQDEGRILEAPALRCTTICCSTSALQGASCRARAVRSALQRGRCGRSPFSRA